MSYNLLYYAVFLCGIVVLRLSSLDYRVIRYNDYLRKFNKSYSQEEFQRRLVYFEESLKEIEKLNNGKLSTGAVHGLTKFSDWSKEEMAKIWLLGSPANPCKSERMPPRGFRSFGYPEESDRRVIFKTSSGYKTVPESLDWRNKDGVIGPVDNQKLCNGCWAFGIVGVVEAMVAIKHGSSAQLSVQQLLDCASYDHNGCGGGNINYALEFLYRYNYKIATEHDYPLKLIKEDCRLVGGTVGITGFEVICNLADDVLLEKLVHGPVLAVVHPTGWQNYNSGVITRNCFAGSYIEMLHVVQIVGYNTITDEIGEEISYYIVKNSWGADWGEDGYIRIARNKNLCGINDYTAVIDVD